MRHHALLICACLLLSCDVPPQRHTLHDSGLPPRQAVRPLRPPQPSAHPLPWAEIRKLRDSGQPQDALKRTLALCQTSQAAAQIDDFRDCLVEAALLRAQLARFEEAATELREAPWPDDALSRTILGVTYAYVLTSYHQAYSYEVRGRPQVASHGQAASIRTWTAEEIFAAAQKAYDQAWQVRDVLQTAPLSWADRILTPNNYPPGVRDTLRDALSYLRADLFAVQERSLDGAEEDTAGPDVKRLLSADLGEVPLLDGEAPRVLKLAAVLADLEQWHLSQGRKESALAARIERIQHLHRQLQQPEDRRALRADLEAHLAGLMDLPLWSTGQSVLADLYQAADDADSLVKAHAAAVLGRDRHPKSPGGAACGATATLLEAKEFQLQSMQQDGISQRSVLVTHKNLQAVHLRLYRDDLVRRIETEEHGGSWLDEEAVRALLGKGKPVKQWRMDLSDPGDFRLHQTFLVPPVQEPGFYVLVASQDPAFSIASASSREKNQIGAVTLLLSDLVLVKREDGRGGNALLALSGNGAPVPGTAITLYRTEYEGRRSYRRDRTLTTDRSGQATLPQRGDAEYIAVARKGRDLALYGQEISSFHESPEPAQTATLVYTDRAVYRPGQKLLWKIVVYRGQQDQGRFQVQPSRRATVRLFDANFQEIAHKDVTTNRFGTASGEFVLPTGRLLGNWTLQTSPGGGATVRVEEYKRPTFETKLLDPEAPLHLQQPAVLRGEARYYYGLPVTEGKVRWTLRRSLTFPSFWSPAFATLRFGPSLFLPPQERQVIASGVAPLQKDGRFEVRFTPPAEARVAPEVARLLSYRFEISADVTDGSGETRSATRAFRICASAVEAQIHGAGGRAFFRAAEEAKLVVQRTDLSGVPRSGKGTYVLAPLQQPQKACMPADVPLLSGNGPRGADPSHTPGDLLRPRWTTDYAPEAMLKQWPAGAERAHGELTHDKAGEATLTLPDLAPGAYRLTYRTQDDTFVPFETAHEFLVGPGPETASGPALLLPLLLQVQDREVRSGGTARLLLGGGFPGQTVFLDRFRQGRLVESRKLVGGPPGVIELAVGDGDRGGFAVRAWMLRDHQLISQIVEVAVPWTDRQLQVAFSTFRDELRPGARETFRVTVKGDGPQALSRGAELLAYMYDRSLDLFAPHTQTDPSALYPTFNSLGELEAGLGTANAVPVTTIAYVISSYELLHGDQFKLASGGFGMRYGRGTIGGGGIGVGGFAFAREKRSYAAKMKMALDDGIDALLESPKASATAPAEAERKAAVFHRADKSVPIAQDRALLQQPPDAPLRENFAETAFFYPHLLVDAEGQAAIEFTVPDSVTSWSVWVHALTADMRGGSAHRETRSIKDLVVRPQMPRFLREGDSADLKLLVSDAAKTRLTGEVLLDIVDPEDPDKKSLAAEFGLPGGAAQHLPFAVEPGASVTLGVHLSAPRRVQTAAFRVSARAGDLSDGELRLLPVLPGRVHLSQSRFITLRDSDQKSIHFADMAEGKDPSLQHDALAVRVDAQLLYSVMAALPYLVRYPYECTEQTLNRFLSTGILASLYKSEPALARVAKDLSRRQTELQPFDPPDPTRNIALEEAPWLQQAQGGLRKGDLDPGQELLNVLSPAVTVAQRDRALSRLARAKLLDGGFPWWPGGPADTYMTLYLMEGFARAAEFGVPVDGDLVRSGWGYLRRHFRNDLLLAMRKGKASVETLTQLNYVLSSYPDKTYTAAAFSDAERNEILDYSFAHWKEHTRYLKGQLALTLSRMGRKADAHTVLTSMMDGAQTTEEQGTFFAPEERSWLWYSDTIETQAFVLQALLEIQPGDPRADGLVKWLLLNRKLNQWKSTRATAEVLYALVRYLKGQGALAVREAATVTVGPRKVAYEFSPDRYTGGNNQIVIPGAEIDPRTMSDIVVAKSTPGLLFASATWTFSTEKMPVQEFGDFFNVSRHYFRRDTSGRQPVLLPLGEGVALHPGDEIEVQLSLRTRHAAEYVHLRDPRAAGLEPESVSSGYRYGDAGGHYEEVRDSGANFYFDHLPAGEYAFQYRLRASMSGTFRAGPATVQSMYAPEFSAYSTGATLTIK